MTRLFRYYASLASLCFTCFTLLHSELKVKTGGKYRGRIPKYHEHHAGLKHALYKTEQKQPIFGTKKDKKGQKGTILSGFLTEKEAMNAYF